MVGVADIHGYLKPNEVFGEHRHCGYNPSILPNLYHSMLEGKGQKDAVAGRDGSSYAFTPSSSWWDTRFQFAYAPAELLLLNPGDVQFVHAIGPPPPDSPFTRDRNPRHNSIVFSTNGLRSVPSMLAGGDLDGENTTEREVWKGD